MSEPGPEQAGGRFAQLTYASSDRAGHSGGLQVQQTRGGLTATERSFLLDRIRTRLPDGEPVPPFPSESEVAALSSRVVYAVRDQVGGAWWHTAPCGADSQGRPGNTFVHVVLDRWACDPRGGDLRPSDLGGRDAPGWLRPFGHREVVGTDLDGVPEPPWPAAPGRDRVLAFLGASSLEVGAFGLLLDAVDAALRGGPPVVLGVRDLHTSADWVAALCHLMSPGTARRLTWSTWERADDLKARPPGVHLAVVPYDDVASAGERSVALYEDEAVPPAGWSDPPRTTGAGVDVAVTAWSSLFYELSAPAEVIPDVLAGVDRVSAEAGDLGLDPAWPLAMVAAIRGATGAEAAARHVLETGCPPHLGAREPALHRYVVALVDRGTAPGVPAAWRSLQEARADGVAARIAVRTDLFLLRAVVDPHWRDTTGPIGALRPRGPVSVVVADAVAARVEEFARELTGLTADRCVPLARAVLAVGELVRAAHLTPPDRLHDIYHWMAAEILLHPVRGPELAAATGDPGGVREAVGAVLGLHLRSHRGEPGTRVAPTVLRMLGVRVPPPGSLRPGHEVPALPRELAAQLTLVDPDPRSAAWPVRAWDALDDPDPGVLDALLDAGRPAPHEPGPPGWDAGHLAVLATHPRAGRLRSCFAAALRGLPPGDGTDALAAAVRDRLGVPDPEDPVAMALAGALHVRLLASGDAPAPELVAVADRVLAAEPADTTSPSIWRAVLAARLAAAVGAAWVGEVGPAPAPGHVPDGLRRAVHDETDRHRVATLLARDPTVRDDALVHAALALDWRGSTPAAWAGLRRTVAAAGAGGGSLPARAAAQRADGRDRPLLDDEQRKRVVARLRTVLVDVRPRGMRVVLGDRALPGDRVDDVEKWLEHAAHRAADPRGQWT